MSIFNDKDSFVVPPSIKLLFNNNQLELIKTLCLLYVLYRESNKKFNKVQDIVFYYSLVNFNMIKFVETTEDKGEPSRNLFYRFHQNINQVILELSNLQFIEINGNITFNISDLGIRLTNKGSEFIEGLEFDFFLELINEYTNAISMVDNNSVNKNKLKGW